MKKCPDLCIRMYIQKCKVSGSRDRFYVFLFHLVAFVSLFQMTVCTKQSVLLHRESVDNLHSVVDANVKVYDDNDCQTVCNLYCRHQPTTCHAI